MRHRPVSEETVTAMTYRGSEGVGLVLESEQNEDAWVRLTGDVYSTFLTDWV